eukprot:TRINITY_DN53591_c0_g1_i1.p1 TRINITY_DN53591_c0_g1~~TRINITY_DN53591_c0_g1_i1.p1  ORF type:complete len:532 (+),score=61.86 TRINITY_DN53591_c0_g1_i1:76-1671(+)
MASGLEEIQDELIHDDRIITPGSLRVTFLECRDLPVQNTADNTKQTVVTYVGETYTGTPYCTARMKHDPYKQLYTTPKCDTDDASHQRPLWKETVDMFVPDVEDTLVVDVRIDPTSEKHLEKQRTMGITTAICLAAFEINLADLNVKRGEEVVLTLQLMTKLPPPMFTIALQPLDFFHPQPHELALPGEAPAVNILQVQRLSAHYADPRAIVDVSQLPETKMLATPQLHQEAGLAKGMVGSDDRDAFAELMRSEMTDNSVQQLVNIAKKKFEARHRRSIQLQQQQLEQLRAKEEQQQTAQDSLQEHRLSVVSTGGISIIGSPDRKTSLAGSLRKSSTSSNSPLSPAAAAISVHQPDSPPTPDFDENTDDCLTWYRYFCRQHQCSPNRQLVKFFDGMILSQVQTLDLNGNFVGPKGFLPVADMCAKCTALESLFVQENNLSNASISYLATTVKGHSSLKWVDLSGNPLTFSAGQPLVDFVTHCTQIQRVRLSNSLVPQQYVHRLHAIVRERNERGKVGMFAADSVCAAAVEG